jgi:hypothetical protein
VYGGLPTGGSCGGRYCAAAVLIEAASAITTTLILARKTRLRRSWSRLLLKVYESRGKRRGPVVDEEISTKPMRAPQQKAYPKVHARFDHLSYTAKGLADRHQTAFCASTNARTPKKANGFCRHASDQATAAPAVSGR